MLHIRFDFGEQKQSQRKVGDLGLSLRNKDLIKSFQVHVRPKRKQQEREEKENNCKTASGCTGFGSGLPPLACAQQGLHRAG